MTDQPGAIWIPSPNFGGLGGTMPKRYVVVHETGGGTSARNIALDFQNPNTQKSTHYIVDLNGDIYQCVAEAETAWGNGIFEPGHAAFLPENINPNRYTISIEHVNSSSTNANPLTSAQKVAGFRLIHDVCQRHSIPMRPGDANGGIIGHNQIQPINRRNCPGPLYPWGDLWGFLDNGGVHMLDIHGSEVATYYDVIDPSHIRAKSGNFIVQFGILSFYLRYGGDAQCGVTYLGLPLSNETAIPGKTQCVIQHFERGIVAYDPQKQLDAPPGSGDVYLMHIDLAPVPPVPVPPTGSEQHYRDLLAQVELAALQIATLAKV